MTRWWMAAVAGLWALGAGAAEPVLHWGVQRNVYQPGQEQGVLRLRLPLPPGQALPASGWALYFNTVSGLKRGPQEGGLVVEQASGTHYRIRPAAGFVPVPAGGTWRATVRAAEPMVRVDKGPRGAYLVFDTDPDRAWPLAVQPEPLQAQAGDPQPPTAEALDEAYRAQAAPPALLPPVFPPPRAWQAGSGTLRWAGAPRIVAPPALAPEAAQLRAWLGSDRQADAAGPPVRLALGAVPGEASPEAYRLVVDPAQGVTLTGRTPAGVARGLQSLRDLLPPRPGAAELPALTVTDAPRYPYRGLMVDIARNFQSLATLQRTVELMARFKLNTLHLHLTDDEGWRLEIPGLPELTAFGARRGHSADPWRHLPPAQGSGADVADPYASGHLTRADYIALLRFAAARRITVLPEIEMPGHARAAVWAMAARERALAGRPEAAAYRLRDPDDKSAYRSAQRYTDNVMDPGLPGPYAFVDKVVGELAAMHREAGVPLQRLHVGADELPAGAWSASPAAAQAMSRLGLKDRDALWNHFYRRVIGILQRHGVHADGWEELGALRVQRAGASRLDANPVFRGQGLRLFVWNNLDDGDGLAQRLATAGYDVVLAPATNLYFDMAHDAEPNEPGVDWATLLPLQQTWAYRPLADAHVLGLQGTLFSEVMRGPERQQRLMLPRLFALAERAWSPAATAEPAQWPRFTKQLGTQVLPRLAAEMPGLAMWVPPPGLRRDGQRVQASTAWPGLVVRYSLDGSEPQATSPVLETALDSKGPVWAAAFAPGGQRSRSVMLPGLGDWPNLARYRQANAALGAPAAGEARVVLMGDSITEGWQPEPGQGLPAGWINRGISGQTTPQMRQRFMADVVALQPRVVVILAGTNDIAGNTGLTTLPTIAGHIAAMAETALAHGIRPVIASVLPATRYGWVPGVRPQAPIIELNRLLRAEAARLGVPLLDYHTPMAEPDGSIRGAYADDGVHPNAAGYRVMRPLVEDAVRRALADG